MSGALERQLPPSIRSRSIGDVNGLRMHVLEAGPDHRDAPTVLLLHGFPELAFSWRQVMPLLADAGYRVIAPDQRGYGRTTGWSPDYDADISPFEPLRLVDDAIELLSALDVRSVASVVGHDFGSPVAGWCGLTRPDLFCSAVMMSAPFAGAPSARSMAQRHATAGQESTRVEALAALPRPRQHYLDYYRTRDAGRDLLHASQGVRSFLRAYFHHKSADWPGNRPRPLASAAAEELALLPTYYVMDLGVGMAETVAAEMPSAAEVAANRWLPDVDLDVFAEEYERTGFQGGLNWYRAATSGRVDVARFAGRTIDRPSLFVAGTQDWGAHQTPGLLERMARRVCTDLQGVEFIDGAGHWVQQEQPAATAVHVLDFLERNGLAPDH